MKARIITALAATALLLSGCASGAGAGAGSSPASGSAGATGGAGVVQFSAAASLTDVAPELTAAYAKDTGDTTRIQINLGASSKLVQQANAGERPDVLITADTEAPQALEQPDAFAAPVNLLSNSLVLAVPADSAITGVDQLPDADAVAICAPAVPCGRAANSYLEKEGIKLGTVSEEDDVRAVLTKVTAGQVDAGFVYATDAAAAGEKVKAIELPNLAPNTYPLLVATDAPDSAQKFAQWLRGDAATQLFSAAGFSQP